MYGHILLRKNYVDTLKKVSNHISKILLEKNIGFTKLY